MADFDVSDAFDPSFFDDIVIIRRTKTTNRGRTVISEQARSAQAVVTPSSPEDLQRLPEEEFMQKAITIYFQGALQGPSDGYEADHVLWHGSMYLVRDVADYSGFGAGFVSAIAVSVQSVDPPPFSTVGSA